MKSDSTIKQSKEDKANKQFSDLHNQPHFGSDGSCFNFVDNTNNPSVLPIETSGEDGVLSKLVDDLDKPVWISNSTDVLVYKNDSFKKLMGPKFDGINILLDDIINMLHPDDITRVLEKLDNKFNMEIRVDCKIKNSLGIYKWVNLHTTPIDPTKSGIADHVTGIIIDIDKYVKNKEYLDGSIKSDLQSNILNIDIFKDKLNDMVEKANLSNYCVSLAILEIDDFKPINRVYGKEYSDTLIIRLGKRLEVIFKGSNSIIGRINGSKFAVASFSNIKTSSSNNLDGVLKKEANSRFSTWNDLDRLSIRLLGNIKAPVFIDGKPIRLSAFVGAAQYPLHASNCASLIRCADVALQSTYIYGRNSYRIYDARLDEQNVEKNNLVMALQKAVHNKEFILHYQPKFNLNTQKCDSVEALIRWKKDDLYNIAPSVFVETLERTGLIISLGAWIIKEACRQMQEWHDQGIANIRVAVNISAKQINAISYKLSSIHSDTGIEETIKRYLKIYPNALLDLELTESTLMLNDESALSLFQNLQNMGVRWSVDDFGTGYSNLSYLRKFPIHTLKIDRSFVCDIENNPDDLAICSAIINMAHTLRLEVVAEGVENNRQLDILKSLSCDYIQGFTISKPLNGSDMGDWLKRQINQ